MPLFAVAPMMDWTDRHDRYFLRLISPHIRLYTEMITTHALLHGDAEYLLNFDLREKYLALQLGGSDPAALATCAKMAEDKHYDEVNLNVGCPSPRVSSGRFGACLMLEPNLVADCVDAMLQAVKIPVTVKCRLGVDDKDAYEDLVKFITTVSQTGCATFIVHARKALLKGLNPKQNRTVPPLNYIAVHQLKKDFPDLCILINGGLNKIETIKEQLNYVDGVMIGREAYHNPYFLAQIEQDFFGALVLNREEVIYSLMPYVAQQLQQGVRLNQISRHILGLFSGIRGASRWRRFLSEHSHLSTAGIHTLQQAINILSEGK